VDRHELDDFKPYIYKTENFGMTWTKITEGLPGNTFVRVVREDPKRKGLLYAGTETGVCVSFDDGAHWQSLQLNLPVVPVHDMSVKESDLVVGTHGRSFWILDDLTPLHQLSEESSQADVFLYKPRDSYRMRGGSYPRPHAGQNPPGGSVIFYYLKEKPEGRVALEFLDSEGNLIKKFTSQKENKESEETARGRSRGRRAVNVTAEAGMNRFVWDMRYEDAKSVPGAILWGGRLNGPLAVPGVYRVKLTAGDTTLEESWAWKKDPRIETSQEDFQEQFDLLIEIRDKITEVNTSINDLRAVKKQVEDLLKKIKDHPDTEDIHKSGKNLKAKLDEIEDVLIQSKSKSGQDPLNYPILLDNKIAALVGVVSSADARPTDQSYVVFKELSGKADTEIEKLNAVLETDLPAFNELVSKADIPAVIIKRKDHKS
jgi:hypothetical protein